MELKRLGTLTFWKFKAQSNRTCTSLKRKHQSFLFYDHRFIIVKNFFKTSPYLEGTLIDYPYKLVILNGTPVNSFNKGTINNSTQNDVSFLNKAKQITIVISILQWGIRTAINKTDGKM